jgi:hypothetical protein
VTNLNSTTVKLRQPEPPEGRRMYPMGTGPGGGDGMNFATGSETFSWSSQNVQDQVKPSAILGLWVDARNLTSGKNLIITTPFQTVIIAGGSQGYVILTAQAPVTVTFTTNGGTGIVFAIAYNYNPLFTGQISGAPVAGTPGGGGGGGSQGGGSGFSQSGGGKGGTF